MYWRWKKKGAVRSLAKALGVDATGLYGSMSEEAASAHLHYWFPNPFPLERTLALIKPGTADTSAKDIMEEIRSQGFTIIQSEKNAIVQGTCWFVLQRT